MGRGTALTEREKDKIRGLLASGLGYASVGQRVSRSRWAVRDFDRAEKKLTVRKPRKKKYSRAVFMGFVTALGKARMKTDAEVPLESVHRVWKKKNKPNLKTVRRWLKDNGYKCVTYQQKPVLTLGDIQKRKATAAKLGKHTTT